MSLHRILGPSAVRRELGGAGYRESRMEGRDEVSQSGLEARAVPVVGPRELGQLGLEDVFIADNRTNSKPCRRVGSMPSPDRRTTRSQSKRQTSPPRHRASSAACGRRRRSQYAAMRAVAPAKLRSLTVVEAGLPAIGRDFGRSTSPAAQRVRPPPHTRARRRGTDDEARGAASKRAAGGAGGAQRGSAHRCGGGGHAHLAARAHAHGEERRLSQLRRHRRHVVGHPSRAPPTRSQAHLPTPAAPEKTASSPEKIEKGTRR